MQEKQTILYIVYFRLVRVSQRFFLIQPYKHLAGRQTTKKKKDHYAPFPLQHGPLVSDDGG